MNNQLPANIANRERRGLLENVTANLGGSRPAHISIRSNRFSLVDAAGASYPVHTLYLDVVLVDTSDKTSKLYYGRPYDDSNDPPLCFSDNGTGPSTQAIEPQAPTCMVCPNNARGSATSSISGQPIKACRDQKKIAVIIAPSMELNDLTVYELTITPGSLTNLRGYANFIGSQAMPGSDRRADLMDFVTRLTFEDGKMGILKFECVAWADNQAVVDYIEYIHQNRLADVVVGRNDVAWDPEAFKAMIAARKTSDVPYHTPPAPPNYQLPPRTVPQTPASSSLPALPPQPSSPPPSPPAAAAPKRPGRPKAQTAPAKTAPFIAPALQEGQTVVDYIEYIHHNRLSDIAPALQEGVPGFLRREVPTQETNLQGDGTPFGPRRDPPPPPSAPRFGIGNAPPPPPAVSDAIRAAMNQAPKRQ
jgi:hypothetical protein